MATPTLEQQIDTLKTEIQTLKKNMVKHPDTGEAYDFAAEYYGASGNELRATLQGYAGQIRTKEAELAGLLVEQARVEPRLQAIEAQRRGAPPPPGEVEIAEPDASDEPCIDIIKASSVPPADGCWAIWEGMKPKRKDCPVNLKIENLESINAGLRSINPVFTNKWDRRGFKFDGLDDKQWAKTVLLAGAAALIEFYWTIVMSALSPSAAAPELHVTSHHRDDGSGNHPHYAAMDYHIKLRPDGDPFYEHRIPTHSTWAANMMLIKAGKLPPGGCGLYCNLYIDDKVWMLDEINGYTGPTEDLEVGDRPKKGVPQRRAGLNRDSMDQRNGFLAQASTRFSGPGGSGGVHYDMRGFTYKPGASRRATSTWIDLDLDGDGKDEIQSSQGTARKFLTGKKVTIRDKRGYKKINKGKRFTLAANEERADVYGPIWDFFEHYKNKKKPREPFVKDSVWPVAKNFPTLNDILGREIHTDA